MNMTRCHALVVVVLLTGVFFWNCNQPNEVPVESNIALNKPATASATYKADTGPEKAVDGDTTTAWNSGKNHPASLEIDLKGSFSVHGISIMLNQSPAGQTAFQAWVSSGTDSVMAARWSSYTKQGSRLDTIFSSPLDKITKIRICSESSPSWISLLEVTVLGTPH